MHTACPAQHLARESAHEVWAGDLVATEQHPQGVLTAGGKALRAPEGGWPEPWEPGGGPVRKGQEREVAS